MRCEICRKWLPTMKKLLFHYVRQHSKIILAGELMKLNSKSAVPRTKIKKLRKITANNKRSETIFANDNVQILCRNNEIIIRDDKSFIDMEFSFDDNNNNNTNTLIEEENNNQPKEFKKLLTFRTKKPTTITTPPSSASSEDCFKQFQFKKRIKRKRDTRNYKINITRSKNYHSLNENTGVFYLCHCRKDNEMKIEDDIKLTSDTESASETGPSLTAFCTNCGNGYENDNLLSQHMKIYKTYCGVCNKIFPTEELFKEHVETHKLKIFVCHICNQEFHTKDILYKHFETHVEDSLLESVVDMEEKYNVVPQNVPDADHQKEVFYGEYESHVQNMHTIYGFDNNDN
ncbi:unnamed protein product [Ceutorhynchus assimilis]|uniref:C2H2-type domain-containing protein n=1 Tax=Ceutorhynchus assimilis TaxID=467358 RepID=A0A9P0GQW4_9CUCU|nr:unnamed protein product [Ceutorhynchus assimilis]